MALKKRSWIAHHVITHHHLIADRLVRVALVLLVVILGAGFFINRWQSTIVKVAVVITGPDTAIVKDGQDFVVDVTNSGAQVRGGVRLLVTSSPGLFIETVDGATYPSDGVFAIDNVQPGAQVRYKVHTQATTLSTQNIIAEVRRTASSTILSRMVHSLVVSKPELHAVARARYYSPEGEQLGRGPLPPKVGETTTYYATMQIPYEGQAWKAIEVSALLGAHVSWADFVPEGARELHYDPATRRVVWRMNAWPAANDELPRDAGASFVIALLPTIDDAGKAVPLLSDIHVTALTTDGERFKASLSLVTTELSEDSKAKGKGIVLP